MPGFESNRFIDLTEREAKLLKCVICLNIFKDPIKSGCEHTFCTSCVQQWVEGNHSTCPECRKGFTIRERSHNVITDDNVVIVGNHIFKRNLMANNLVNDLKTKCSFKSNGCQEVLEFGLLWAHIRQCKHRFCKTCGLEIGNPDQHNCLQLLKNDRIELKDQMSTLQAMINSYEDEKVISDNKLREMGEKISDLKKYHRLSSLLMSATKLSLPLVLKPDYVLFSAFKATVQRIQLNSESINLMEVSSYAEVSPLREGRQTHHNSSQIDVYEIEELICCLDPTLPAIIIKPKTDVCAIINDFIEETTDFAYGFARQQSDHYIIIVLKNEIKHFIAGFVNYCKHIQLNIKCKVITVDRIRRMIEKMGFKDNNSIDHDHDYD